MMTQFDSWYEHSCPPGGMFVDAEVAPGLLRAPSDPTPRSTGARFSFALAEMSLAVQAEDLDRQGQLQAVTDAAVSLLPGVGGAAVVADAGRGRLSVKSWSAEFSSVLVDLQNELREGPCLSAVALGRQSRVHDVGRDPRWPRFAQRAAALQVGSMICTPLIVDGRVIGSLSLVFVASRALDEWIAELAAVFAAHAAVALRAAQTRTDLLAALSSREVIGQAKGVLMERCGIPADQAFLELVRASQLGNIKLRTIAEQVCTTTSGRGQATVTP